MITRICRDFDFLAAVHFENEFLMNHYNITLSMDVLTDSISEQNIAMDRLKYLVYEVLANVVFVDSSETKLIEKYQAAGMRVCTTPEAPYDQIISLLLFYKFNSVTEGKLLITNLQLESLLSDGVGFMLDEDILEATPFKLGWWTENNVLVTDKTVGKKEKIVKMIKKSDWLTLGLDWKSLDSPKPEIIFTPEVKK